MITMLLARPWHGANIAFIFWGFLHGFYLVLQRLIAPVLESPGQVGRMPIWIENTILIASVYSLTLLAWVYFRSGSIGLMGGDSFGTANTGSWPGFSALKISPSLRSSISSRW